MNSRVLRSRQLSLQIPSLLKTARAPNVVKQTTARLYASSSVPEQTPHTPDTYQKDDTVSEPSSSKTHVVSGQPEGDERTQRPFESPTGAYTTTDDSKPYDTPADISEEHNKSKYGGVDRGGGGAKDVSGSDGPQDRGRTGRQ